METKSAPDAILLLQRLQISVINNFIESSRIIDELCSTATRSRLRDQQEIEDLILQILKVIPSDKNSTLSKFTFFLSSLFRDQKLNNNIFDECCLLELFTEESSSLLARHNSLYCVYDLLRQENFSNISFEICGVKCCYLIKNELQSSDQNSALTAKVFVNALKCLQMVFPDKTIKWKNVGEILGLLKVLLFYGLPGQTNATDSSLFPTLRCPETAIPYESQSESDAPYPKLRKNKRNRRKEKKTPQKEKNSENSCVAAPSPTSKFLSSSDSEVSDTENSVSRIKRLHISVRHNAYLTLHAFLQTLDKKVMFGYWSSFLPEHPAMPGFMSTPNIFTTILKDPAAQVRVSALAVLIDMLSGSKQFLAHADGRNPRQMSFTSLSSILATMISEIHRCLLLALLAENSSSILTQILKAFAVLCENTPYFKLNKDILFKFLKPVKNMFSYKDPQVQVASLSVFTSLISSEQMPPEMETLWLSGDFDAKLHDLATNALKDEAVGEKPWLTEMCKIALLGDELKPIRVQSLQLLSNFVGKYFNKSEHFLPDVGDIVVRNIGDSDGTVQLYAAKLLDVLGRCVSNVTDTETKQKLDDIVRTTWSCVLSDPLLRCLGDQDNKALQAVCCDCLSSLDAKHFQQLSPRQQISYQTILLGLASDGNPTVRGAAIRCLGIYALFPELTQDASFVQDVSRILVDSVTDSNMNVRFKASWSLANLSDVAFNENCEMSPQFLTSLFCASLGFARDGDRIRANAVRALGNFLRNASPTLLAMPTIQEYVKDSCNVLKTSLSASFMKVCWNACYAMGNVFKNTCLFEKDLVNPEDILRPLLCALKSSNFKVRISAAQALTSVQTREHYGVLFEDVWRHLVAAFQSSAEDLNFKEARHQENLTDQLCLSLVHLSDFVSPDDVSQLQDIVIANNELLLTLAWKFGTRATHEKNSKVCQTIEKLSALKNDFPATTLFVNGLLDIFNQAVMAYFAQNDR